MHNETLKKTVEFFDMSLVDVQYLVLKILIFFSNKFVKEALKWEQKILAEVEKCEKGQLPTSVSKRTLIRRSALHSSRINKALFALPTDFSLKKTKGNVRMSNFCDLLTNSVSEYSQLLVFELIDIQIVYLKHYMKKLCLLLSKIERIYEENSNQNIHIKRKLVEIEASRNSSFDQSGIKGLNFSAVKGKSLIGQRVCPNDVESRVPPQNLEIINSVVTFYCYEGDDILRNEKGDPVLDDFDQQIFIDTTFKNYLNQINNF